MLKNLSLNRSVLVLGPHPDDELGCGGTIAKLIDNGLTVYHYFFSPCEESLKALNLTTEQLTSECNKSRTLLGIKLEYCGNFNFPVRYFPHYRQEILETLISLKRKIDPGLVFVPNGADIHQDHHCIYEESIRAFKHTTILGYELPWNTLTMSHDCLVVLDAKYLRSKIFASRAYVSQMHRVYANVQFFQSLAKVRGVQANAKYAECFEVIRLIL
jgi:LmbE family N-acetylglucosaminyl deacetylase